MFQGKHAFVPPQNDLVIVKPQFDARETLRNFFTFSGTTIHLVIWKPVTWISIFLHFFGYFYMHSRRESCGSSANSTCWADDYTTKYSIQSTDITVFTSLVVFLFVSYTNMCSRFESFIIA